MGLFIYLLEQDKFISSGQKDLTWMWIVIITPRRYTNCMHANTSLHMRINP